MCIREGLWAVFLVGCVEHAGMFGDPILISNWPASFPLRGVVPINLWGKLQDRESLLLCLVPAECGCRPCLLDPRDSPYLILNEGKGCPDWPWSVCTGSLAGTLFISRCSLDEERQVLVNRLKARAPRAGPKVHLA